MADEVVNIEELRIQIRKEERDEAEKHYNELFEVWKAKELADLSTAQSAEIQKNVQILVDKWIADQGPPSKEQIQILLDQEYATFPLQIQVEEDLPEGETAPRYKKIEFVLTELPQKVEKQFFRKFKQQVIDLAPQINAWTQKNLDKPVEEQVRGFLESVDGGIELMSEAVALVLNPRGKRPEITKEWVENNVSSLRQWNILQAQLDASRLRDFFSRVSRSGREIQMMTSPANSQKLRELAL